MFPKSLLERSNWSVNECLPHTLQPKKLLFVKSMFLRMDGTLFQYESDNDFTNRDLMKYIHQYYTSHLSRDEIEHAAKEGNDAALKHLRKGTVMLRSELFKDAKFDRLEFFGVMENIPIYEVIMR